MAIPKIIHQTFNSRNDLDAGLLTNIEKLKDLNKGWDEGRAWYIMTHHGTILAFNSAGGCIEHIKVAFPIKDDSGLIKVTEGLGIEISSTGFARGGYITSGPLSGYNLSFLDRGFCITKDKLLLCADPWSTKVVCNRTACGAWEVFNIVDETGGIVQTIGCIARDIYQILILDGGGLPSKLPEKLRLNIESVKLHHPDARHHLFGGNDVREFLKSNFDSDVLFAYDKLKPYSYKADLAKYMLDLSERRHILRCWA